MPQVVKTATARRTTKQERDQLDRRFMVLALALIAVAWIVGYVRNGADVAALVPDVLPGTARVDSDGDLFVGRDGDGNIIGYAALGEAPGYGGPLEVLIGVWPDGAISGVTIVSQRESPGFFRLIANNNFMQQFDGSTVRDPLSVGADVDAVSGATISSEGLARSVQGAARLIAARGLQISLPPVQHQIKFGLPEVILLLLFAAGDVGHKVRNGAWKRRVRWATLLTGMLFLGFVYTLPFTTTMVVSLLSGYWPDWHNNLYWYLLVGGIVFATTVDGKNPYCGWFCPFGAVQECLATVSGAKHYRPRDLNRLLKWVQRMLALSAIVLGLLLRRPGISSYEPFATLFDFRGLGLEWAFLILVLLVSLLMYRPFCNYLCPLDAVVEFVGAGRRWIKEGWSTWRERQTTA